MQLVGSVGNATVTVAPLRSPEQVLASASSYDPAQWIADIGEDKWTQQSSFVQLLAVGMARPVIPELDPDALYLITATGGEDYDPRGRVKLSQSPEAVQGSWHAIASGQRIMDGNLKVSALSEALYQQFRLRFSQWSDAELKQRLEATAQLVIGDVDDSGSVDYNDVLDFSRSLDGNDFLGSLNKLDALAAAVAAGQPATALRTQAEAAVGKTTVDLNFDAGTVTLRTLNWDTPITAANFLGYARSGFYDSGLVHRAIEGFMIQMGGFAAAGEDDNGRVIIERLEAGDPIINEAGFAPSNTRGTLSMARTTDPNSATSQFFINQVNNSFLDFASSQNPDGYAVFARVISGMEVVDAIAAEATVSVSGVGSDVPARGVVLESVDVR
ncbi:MAG: peptidylprolyl isomerase [Pseudomonadota bacterium]